MVWEGFLDVWWYRSGGLLIILEIRPQLRSTQINIFKQKTKSVFDS